MILQSKLVERKKMGLIFFPGLIIYGGQEPLRLLNVMEDDCYFGGVHMRLSWAVYKLFFSKSP